MAKQQPSYTKEFKQEAVHLVESSKKSKSEIARDLGISDSALSTWCKALGNDGEQAFPGKGHHIKRLLKKNYDDSKEKMRCSNKRGIY